MRGSCRSYKNEIENRKEVRMAVHSGSFSGLRLSGEDAKKFVNQVRHSNKSRAAQDFITRGSEMAKKLAADGQVKA